MKGLLGLFDILGFKDLIGANAGNESLSRAIIGLINEMNSIDKIAFIGSDFDPDTVEFFKPNSICYADTIILFLEEKKLLENPDSFFTFFFQVQKLMVKGFVEGIPLRGAITFDEFFQENHCLSGKAFIDLISIEENQNWSGCVLSKALMIELEKQIGKDNFSKWNCLKFYDAPFKKKPEIASDYIINWFPAFKYHYKKPDQYKNFILDLKGQLFKRFGGWNRQDSIVDDVVKNKIANTEKYFNWALQIECIRGLA